MAKQNLTAGGKINTGNKTREIIYANDYEVRIKGKGRYPLPYVLSMIDDGEFVVVK